MGILDTVSTMNKKAVIVKETVGNVTDAMVKNTEFMKQQADKALLPHVPETSKPQPKSKGMYEMFADNIAEGMKQAPEVIPSAPFKQVAKRVGDIQNEMARNIDETVGYAEKIKPSIPEPTNGEISVASRFNAQRSGRDNIRQTMGIKPSASIPKPADGEIRKAQFTDAYTLGKENINEGVLDSSRKAFCVIPEPKEGEIRKGTQAQTTFKIPVETEATVISQQEIPIKRKAEVETYNPLFDMGKKTGYIHKNPYVENLYKGALDGLHRGVTKGKKVFASEEQYIAKPKNTSPEIYGMQNQAPPIGVYISPKEKQYIVKTMDARTTGEKITKVKNQYNQLY